VAIHLYRTTWWYILKGLLSESRAGMLVLLVILSCRSLRNRR
jgi:hypothetical protein